MLVAVPLMALLATALAAPVNVSLSSSVVSVVNTTDQYRACWVDSDCVSYPFCRKKPENCKCMTNGSCLLIRGYGQHCTSHQNCGDAMHCVTPTPQPLGGSRLKSVCKCVPHAKFSRYMNQCLRVNPPVLGGEMPRFADLPNPGEEDAGVPEEIPATYGGALLVGSLSSGLVLGCLILSLWCHYTTNQQRKKLLASQRSLYSSKEQPPSDETGGEKIPLDTYLPPPEMYQTPGFHNYLAISDCVSTSHIHEQLGTLGSELNRTLSLSCGEEYTNNKPPKKSNSNNSSVNV